MTRTETGSLERGERNIRINTINGILNATALNMVSPFTAIFAMRIGASQLQVALLTSAPAVVSLVAMVPGATYVDQSDRKKHLTYLFMFANRVFYLLLALVPLLAPAVQAWVFVALLAVMNLPGAIGNVAWQAFISKIVPAEKRARAFAARSRLMNIFGTAMTVAAGLFLDRVVFPIGYQIVFVGAFAVAVAEVLVFNRLREEPPPDAGEAPADASPVSGAAGTVARRERAGDRAPWGFARARAIVREIRSEKRFARYTLLSMLFYLAWQIPWPLFSWYQVKVLHANNLWVSILALANTGGALFGYAFWQRMLDRRGNLETLFVSTFPIFIVPAIYAFSRQLWVIAVANLVIGAIFSGVNLALFNTLLEVTPDRKKASYIAYYTTAITATSVVAPLIGVSLLGFMSFMWAFLLCALLRFLGSLGFRYMARLERREGGGGAKPPPERVYFGTGRGGRFSPRSFLRWSSR